MPRPRLLAILLAGLGMLGPFSVDTYLPAFTQIARSLQASPLQMQQTLSAYLFAFAFMNLFHGALADRIGRRPVVLAGLAVFTLSSLGCALAGSIGTLVTMRALQGMATGAGIVVSRAVIRDLYPPAQAQKMMSQVTLWFGIAPAIAPMLGAALLEHVGWRAIFGLLASIGIVLLAVNFRWLAESLPVSQRQSFAPAHLLRGYLQLGASRRFMALALASGIPFNGMFLYVVASPAFLGELLGLEPARFFWLFVCTIAGIMAGALVSGRLAGRVAASAQIRLGFRIMGVASLVNLALNLSMVPPLGLALAPIAVFSAGWALNAPAITLLALEVVPQRRGMASSLQAVIASAINGVVAGAVAPLVMHSTVALAGTSALMLLGGLAAWRWATRHKTAPHPHPKEH
jgi:DHA1 family bicyclomycin/chloramphenicol resistance-like MFS transporter